MMIATFQVTLHATGGVICQLQLRALAITITHEPPLATPGQGWR